MKNGRLLNLINEKCKFNETQLVYINDGFMLCKGGISWSRNFLRLMMEGNIWECSEITNHGELHIAIKME